MNIASYQETRKNTITDDSGRAKEGSIWKWPERTLKGGIHQTIAFWRVIPCNNGKSDVFSYEEFLKIGEAIGKAKKWTI